MIGPFGLQHIWLVRNLQQSGEVLDLESALLAPRTPLRLALQGLLLHSGTRTYVLRSADAGGDLVGFAQVRVRRGMPAWDVTSLAPNLSSSEQAATVWYRLLLHLCIAAGECQMLRLFARLPEDHPAGEVFHQAGFAVYSLERMFVSTAATAPIGLSSSTRITPIQPRDSWDLKRLFHRTVPRLVLQAEDLDLNRSTYSSFINSFLDHEQGYVVRGRSDELLAYAHLVSGSQGSWLRLMALPNLREPIHELLDHVLGVIRDQERHGPLYCTVRDYQGGIQSPLEERGFEFIGKYSLLVKHTTVHVRERIRKLVPSLEKRAEIAPTVSRSDALEDGLASP